ncbi:MAG: hypothetical protein IPH27_16080 [Actinomycetales bacterium]|jgi:hypothetical protein|nr:hypothetical protein [Candidatus Phosphoribacter baldrii]MBK6956888.1 hypothetical protein [Candidatus Phosphoribacter baldrii]
MAEARGLRRRFVTRVDVEDAARAGVGITLGPTDVLTDEARSRARDLRVVVSVTGAGSGVGVDAGAGVGVAPSGWVGNQLGQLGRGGASARGNAGAAAVGSGSSGSSIGSSGSGASGSGPSLRDRVQAAVIAELGHVDDRVVQTIEAVLARRGLS